MELKKYHKFKIIFKFWIFKRVEYRIWNTKYISHNWYKKVNNEYFIYINNGKLNTQIRPDDFIERIYGYAGELIINNIDNDGMMNGIDENYIETIYKKIKIPLVVMGGIGSILEVSKIFRKFDIIGVACGSLFIYKGRNRAVLINYPKNEILSNLD